MSHSRWRISVCLHRDLSTKMWLRRLRRRRYRRRCRRRRCRRRRCGKLKKWRFLRPFFLLSFPFLLLFFSSAVAVSPPSLLISVLSLCLCRRSLAIQFRMPQHSFYAFFPAFRVLFCSSFCSVPSLFLYLFLFLLRFYSALREGEKRFGAIFRKSERYRKSRRKNH